MSPTGKVEANKKNADNSWYQYEKKNRRDNITKQKQWWKETHKNKGIAINVELYLIMHHLLHCALLIY